MLKRLLVLACSFATFLVPALPATQALAQTRIVNINAKVSGCTSDSKACDIGAQHLPPGSTFHMFSPVNIKLEAGTYRISYAGAQGRYKGWMYNSDRKWVWNFGIATPIGGGAGRLLYLAIAGGNYTGHYPSPAFGVFDSLAELTASNGPIYGGRGGPNTALPRLARSGGPTAYTDTLTLPADTTLSFFVLDWDLHDNIGGVSVKLERLNPKAAGLLPRFEATIAAAGSDKVRAFQQLLADRGFYPGTPDGRYGPATRKALANCISQGKCDVTDLQDK